MPQKNHKKVFLSLITILLSGCSSNLIDNTVVTKAKTNEAINPKAILGGKSSVKDSTREAFSHFSPKLSFDDKTKFFVGESFFDQNWIIAPSSTVARDGLGPHFNARSCASCHFKDGRGKPPGAGESIESLLLRVSIPGKSLHDEPLPSHIYGDQLQGFAIPNVLPEVEVKISHQDIKGQFADGEQYLLKKPIYDIKYNYGEPEEGLMISPRISSQMIGMGLLEDISERDLLAIADPDDKNADGISGKANYVWDVENKRTVMGRFGWKANQPSIRQQVAAAFSGDIGITTSIFIKENYTDKQFETLKPDNIISGGSPELSDKNLEKTVLYSRNLAVPIRRNVDDLEVSQGEKLFSEMSCNKCHITEIKSGDETIRPYTDLLLHDMGDNLADNRPDFLASGNEWRTPPLWGIGLFNTVNSHTNYLHDGRANSLSEAILWHGGEAGKSAESFKRLNKSERNALIKFLESL